MSVWSHRGPLTAFKQEPSAGQPVSPGWPANHHLLLQARQVNQYWDTAEREGTQEVRGGMLVLEVPWGERTVSLQSAVRGGRKTRGMVELLVCEGSSCKRQGRRHRSICCALSPGWGCKVVLQMRAGSIYHLPSPRPSLLILEYLFYPAKSACAWRDLISIAVWNSISPVRRALTMELPCVWWVMSALIYCPWVLWKCRKTVTLPHCWALRLVHRDQAEGNHRDGAFRGEKMHSNAATDTFQHY